MRNNKIIVTIVLIFATLLCLTACSNKKQKQDQDKEINPLIGTWLTIEDKYTADSTLEFQSNGTAIETDSDGDRSVFQWKEIDVNNNEEVIAIGDKEYLINDLYSVLETKDGTKGNFDHILKINTNDKTAYFFTRLEDDNNKLTIMSVSNISGHLFTLDTVYLKYDNSGSDNQEK